MTEAPAATPVPPRAAGHLERALLVALVALPVAAVVGPWLSLRPGQPGQLYAYRVLGVVLALPAAFLAWRNRRNPFVLGVTAVLGFAVVWSAASLGWTADRVAGRKEVIALGSSAFMAWVTVMLTEGRRERIRALVAGWFLAFATTIAVAAVEVTTGRHLVLLQDVDEWRFRHALVAGFANNPNGLAAVLVLVVGLALGLLLRSRTRGATLVGLGTCVVAPLMIVGTNSRGATLSVVALALAAAVAAVWWRRRMVGSSAAVLAAAGLAAAIVVALPSSALAYLDRDVNPGSYYLPTPAAGAPALPPPEKIDEVQQAESDQGRVELMRRGLTYFAEQPLQGRGAGSFMTLLENDPTYRGAIINAHNLPVQWLTHYGLVGTLPIVGLLGWVFWSWLDPRRRGRWGMETLAGLAGLATTSILAADATGEPFTWAALAVSLACVWARSRRQPGAGASAADVSRPAGR